MSLYTLEFLNKMLIIFFLLRRFVNIHIFNKYIAKIAYKYLLLLYILLIIRKYIFSYDTTIMPLRYYLESTSTVREERQYTTTMYKMMNDEH